MPFDVTFAVNGGFDVPAFLREHWQKRPLLIRDPWSAWVNPLDPDELAGLACEEDVESRLITRGRRWKLEHGPFPEARFAKPGKKPWTLLVQAVDHYVPAVAALIEPFRFVPDWRIDDVMVSYATDGGGVGPHFDRYDVFLVQGLGRRRWRVGGPCDDRTPLLPHDDLRLLAEFEATEEWVLEPGDILYVPPGIAHEGTAVGDDCMTYSVGFRSPSRGELVAGWCDDLVERLGDDDRYADPDLSAQPNPGEIAPEAMARMHALVTEALGDSAAFARWFGRYNTTPRASGVDWTPEEPATAQDVRDRLAGGTVPVRNPASRFSFVRQDAGLLLFVDGECFECTGEAAVFAERLCAGRDLTPGASPAEVELVVALLNQGSVSFDADG